VDLKTLLIGPHQHLVPQYYFSPPPTIHLEADEDIDYYDEKFY
jgi:hypothetical protein